MIKHATISECLLYRYTLSRVWDPALKHVLFTLLNPSKADAERDDHTLRKGMGFARRWGYGGVVFTNEFGWRATSPKDMKKAQDPIGPANDSYILAEAERAELIVLAWGTHGSHRGRDKEVLKLLTPGHASKLYHLGKNKDGSPKHPLTLSYDTPLEKWK